MAFLDKLKSGLAKTKQALFGQIFSPILKERQTIAPILALA